MGLAKYAEDNMEIYLDRMSDLWFKQHYRIEITTTMPIMLEHQSDNSFTNTVNSNVANPISSFQDRILFCKDCYSVFVWTSGEQAFFKKKNLQQPKRCKKCRERRVKMCS